MRYKTHYIRRRVNRVLISLKHFKSRNKSLFVALVTLGIILSSRIWNGKWTSKPNTSSTFLQETELGILVDDPACRIIRRGPAPALDHDEQKCSHNSCSQYATVSEINDTTSLIELTSNARICPETSCCASVYSMPRRNYDEVRYPPKGCHELKSSELIHPSVYTEVLEVSCADLCENRRVTNFFPLFAHTSRVEQKLNAWQYSEKLMRKVPRVVVLNIVDLSMENLSFLPETMAELSSFHVLHGYAMTDDSRTSNFIALLTGSNMSHLSTKCSFKSLGAFDGCPFIWKEFRNLDYVTAYVDEYRLRDKSAHVNSHSIMDVDFIAQPTDYYIPASFMKEKMKPIQMETSLYNTFASSSSQTFIVDYAEAFTLKFQHVPFIGIFSMSLPKQINKLDLKLASLLKTLKASNNILTVLSSIIVNSDYSSERPLLYMSLPTSLFKSSNKPAQVNLDANSRRLVTAFDVHKTLHHVAQKSCKLMGMLETECFNNIPSQSSNGISLMEQVVPHRTCNLANITPKVCPCSNVMGSKP